ILVVLSRSPTALVVVVALVVAEFALSIARRTRRPARRRTNIVIAAVTVLGVVATLLFSRPIASFFAARSGFASRTELWSEIAVWIAQRPVTGWSFFGTWEDEPFPTNV